MKRIHHPYWDWEDWRAGMWRSVSASERRTLLTQAITFTGDAELYGSFMRRVILEWPKACEHNLTEPGMNRLAWVGHAAACLAIGAPEDVTRQAWAFLTEKQQVDADAQAEATVIEWINGYEAQNKQLPLFMEEARVLKRNPGRGRRQAGSVVQGPELPGDLSGDHSQRRVTQYAGFHAGEVRRLHGTQAN